MKSLKKTLVLLVAVSMILTTLVPAFAATDVAGLDCEDAVLRMEALEILKGYADGTFGPEKTITRAEAAVVVGKMVGITEGAADAVKNTDSKFSDVKAGEWYTGWINLATGAGIISGYPDNTFRPNDPLTMNHVLTLCVNALGRGVYVSQEGTWPANYVTEAARLGLLDDVEGSVANRGNVAIVAWNTLQAPVWGVGSTKDLEITKGEVTDTLLATHFRNFVYEDKANALGFDRGAKFFKEAEKVTVEKVPSMDKDLGSRQIVLELDAADDTWPTVAFDDEPGKNEEESTYGTAAELIAYVPEDVHEDLESLYGKEVTVIFGKDNVVAMIFVTDDAYVDNELVEKIDVENDKITIAGTAYKYFETPDADDDNKNTAVYVNGVPFGDGEAQIKAVLEAIGVDSTSTRSLTKALKANVILNNKDKVIRIDFTISGKYYIDEEDFTATATDADYTIAQYVVEKVKTKGDVIAVGVNGAIYNYKDLIDDENEPKVVKGTKEISLEEIDTGDVLTVVYTGEENPNNLRTIYVSSERATGEAKVKTTLDVTVDSNKYLANKEAKMTSTGELEDAETAITYTELKKIAGEDVELYLNILGEYVALVANSSAADGLFGVITSVSNVLEDEDNDFSEYRSVKIMLPNGEKATRYQLVYDEKTDTTEGASAKTLANAGDLLHKLVTFKAGSDNKILIDDVTVVEPGTEGYVDGVEGKVIELADADAVDYDKKRISHESAGADDEDREYSFTGAKFLNYADDDKEVEALSKGWKSLIAEANDGDFVADITKLEDAIIVVDENDDVLLVYSLIDSDDFVPSDDIFAVVTNIDHKESGKETVTVKTVSGEEETYEAGTVNLLTNSDIETADFVMFTVKDGKIDTIDKLFDVIALNDMNNDVALNDATCEAGACVTASHAGRVVATAATYSCTETGCAGNTTTGAAGACVTAGHTGRVVATAATYTCAAGLTVNTLAKLSGTAVSAIQSAIVNDDTTKENLTFDYNSNRTDRLYYTEDVTAETDRVASGYINEGNLVIVDLSNMTEDCEGIEFVDSLEEIDGEIVIAITINDETDDDDEGAEILVVVK